MHRNWLYRESRAVWEYLQTEGKQLDWAMLCPSLMFRGSVRRLLPHISTRFRDVIVTSDHPDQRQAKPLQPGYNAPPRFPLPGWVCRIPLLGGALITLVAAAIYAVSYESVAQWLAENLTEERARGRRVALRERGRGGGGC
jgi:hypothetical protein